MDDENAVKTAENSGRKATGKPFVKGDPRINRAGRPKNFDGFRRLIHSKMNEPALDKDGNQIIKDGHIVTNAEMFVEAWMKSKDRKSFAEFAYGKVREEIDVTSGGEKILQPETMKPSEIAARVAALLEKKE